MIHTDDPMASVEPFHDSIFPSESHRPPVEPPGGWSFFHVRVQTLMQDIGELAKMP